MLEELLRCDKLGSKDEILFVLFDALDSTEDQRLDQLRSYCISSSFSIGKSFNGIIKLLEFISFIQIVDGKVKFNKQEFNQLNILDSQNYFSNPSFIINLIVALKKENSLTHFFNADALKFNSDTGRFYIKENLIPFKYMPIRNLFFALNYFERDVEISNHLLIPITFNDAIITMVVAVLEENQQATKKKISLEVLKKSLEKKEEAGKLAEIFVHLFEQKRLRGHPLLSSVKCISEDFVNAGYDIESFNDRESIIIDRYIEVKSYSGEVSFYWSKNEVETAKQLGDKYFLYLVDRLKLSQVDYTPSVFQNPYDKIFQNEYWIKETENWKIQLDKDSLK